MMTEKYSLLLKLFQKDLTIMVTEGRDQRPKSKLNPLMAYGKLKMPLLRSRLDFGKSNNSKAK